MNLFEHTEVFNIEGALRGMRNPMDSWEKSDSKWLVKLGEEDMSCYYIGPNDMNLCNRLIIGGPEHRKFLRQIFVCVDITAPRYWWSEFDTYKVGTTANSCSTMHKITAYPFTADMFAFDGDMEQIDIEYIQYMAKYLELLRLRYTEESDKDEKMRLFRRIKQSLPESFLQKRTVTMTYENVYNIVHQRCNHRLYEWNTDFVGWAMSLPYAEQFIFRTKE